MKTRLLKRLRREARKEFPDDMILMLAECKGYFGALKFVNEAMRSHILLRVAELKGKRRQCNYKLYGYYENDSSTTRRTEGAA